MDMKGLTLTDFASVFNTCPLLAWDKVGLPENLPHMACRPKLPVINSLCNLKTVRLYLWNYSFPCTIFFKGLSNWHLWILVVRSKDHCPRAKREEVLSENVLHFLPGTQSLFFFFFSFLSYGVTYAEYKTHVLIAKDRVTKENSHSRGGRYVWFNWIIITIEVNTKSCDRNPNPAWLVGGVKEVILGKAAEFWRLERGIQRGKAGGGGDCFLKKWHHVQRSEGMTQSGAL